MTQSLYSRRASRLSAFGLLLLSLAFRVGASAFVTRDTHPQIHHKHSSAAPVQQQSAAASGDHAMVHEPHGASSNVRVATATHDSTKVHAQSVGTAAKGISGAVQNSSQHHFLSSSTPAVAGKGDSSPRWAAPRRDQKVARKQNRTTRPKVTSSAVVSPRSQILLKKLEGGHHSDLQPAKNAQKCGTQKCAKMRKLDQAFVLKLLQGGGDINKFAFRKRHLAKRRGGRQAIATKAKTQNQSVAVSSANLKPLALVQPKLECNVGMRVSLKMDKDLRCPEKCPLMVKDKGSGAFCDFKCVGNTVADCRAGNPKTTVPDPKKGVCRACNVAGCALCLHDGTDSCSECASGYQMSNGKCHSQFTWMKYTCCGILGLLVVFFIAWVVTLYNRPITNLPTLHHALEVRSRTKLHQPLHLPEDERGVRGTPTADGRARGLWPLTTNLCTTDVAGPGLTLAFNFQAALIIWALVVALVWLSIGLKVEYPTLFVLGTRRAQTDWQNCWIVQWGYDAQKRLMWTKVGYLIFVYLFTFIGAIVFGICQLRRFNFMDQSTVTHKDFCAKIIGLPSLIGSVLVEDEIKSVIAEASQQRIIGVSVCWDMGDKEDLLMAVIEDELDKRDTELHGQSLQSLHTEQVRYGMINRFFSAIESVFLSPTTQKILTKNSRHKSLKGRHSGKATRPDPKDEETGHVCVVDPILELNKLQTTTQAYVVFETETARNEAVVTMSTGVEFRGVILKVEEASCEPDSLLWGHVHNESTKDHAKNIIWGMCMIVLALLVWTVVFYLPFVWVALYGNYANGQEPDALAAFTFGMVVVAGNALMYVVCGEVCDRIPFHRVDSRELCYLGLYLFACVFNVILDMMCAYYVAYYAMVGVGMKTYDGTPLKDVKTFPERFETYAMQRELGRTWLGYTMPFTTLVPFLIEPFITIYLPWKVMVAIVRTKPEIQGVTAEAYLKPLVMDMSRYADLLLNVMLAVGILMFPGGFNLTMFFGLALSHMYIYALDHYRVLRSITACDFASTSVDWWAQWVMCIPCGVVLACYVYKSNCEGYVQDSLSQIDFSGDNFWYCVQGSGLLLKCWFAFMGHVILHTIMLVFLVPCFGRKQEEASEEHFEHCARRLPISWFSGNPVHCLRSQFIYDHSPPCDYSMLGKQHLVRVNPSIGSYFSEKENESEDYTEPSMDDLRHLSSRKAVDAVTSLTSRLHRQSAGSKDENNTKPSER